MINNHHILLDFIKLRNGNINISDILLKYNYSIDDFNEKRKQFVTKYNIDPRFIYKNNEIGEELFFYLNESNNNITVDELIRRVKEFDEKVADTYVVTRRSILTDSEGNIKQQWERQDIDKFKFHEERVRSIEKLCSNIPAVKTIKILDSFVDYKDKDDYSVLLPLADMHLGVKIEKSRTSSKLDWGIEEAKKAFYKSISYILNAAPVARELVIADLGDILHMADNTFTTPKSGHHLDSDCSLETAMDALFELLYALIDAALTKYEHIYLYSTPGNHNMDISYIIKEVIRQRYRDMQDRVHVSPNQGNSNIYYHSFGRNLLAFTHGDEIKHKSIETVVWSDNKNTISNYDNFDAYMGHYHQDKQTSKGMVNVRVIKNFSPNDKWADSMGFRNLKNPGFMQAFIYHKKQGLVSNIMYNPVID